MTVRKPDTRPTSEVYHWFDRDFETSEFPNVSWALGSDWGWGYQRLNADTYKELAYRRLAEIYGPRV